MARCIPDLTSVDLAEVAFHFRRLGRSAAIVCAVLGAIGVASLLGVGSSPWYVGVCWLVAAVALVARPAVAFLSAARCLEALAMQFAAEGVLLAGGGGRPDQSRLWLRPYVFLASPARLLSAKATVRGPAEVLTFDREQATFIDTGHLRFAITGPAGRLDLRAVPPAQKIALGEYLGHVGLGPQSADSPE